MRLLLPTFDLPKKTTSLVTKLGASFMLGLEVINLALKALITWFYPLFEI